MRAEHYRILRQGRTRRLMRAAEPESRLTAELEPKPAPRETQGRRFVGPLRLTEKQKQEIVQALKEQGIGDYESRHLFAGAAEYELATFQHYARFEEVEVRIPGERRADVSRSGLKAATDELIAQLARTGAEAVAALEQRTTPPEHLRRTGWTSLLRCELFRLAKACEHPQEIEEPETTTQVSRADPASTQRFAQSVARTFEECFDRKVIDAPGSPFRLALELITSAVGIRLADLDSRDDGNPGAVP